MSVKFKLGEKEYELREISAAPAATSATAPTLPTLKVGDVFDWRESHRTTRGGRTLAGKRVITRVYENGAIDFVVLSSGRIDKTGPKMLRKDVKYVQRGESHIYGS